MKGHLLSSVEKFDSVKEKWRPISPLPIAIKNPCAIGFKGRLYVFGGHGCDGISGRVFW